MKTQPLSGFFLGVFSIVLAAFIGITLVWVPAVAEAKVFRWRAQHFLPSQMEGYKEFVRWCENIKAASDGRLIIKPFPPGAAVPSAEMWEAVSKGVLQMGLSYGAYWVGKTPVAGFSVGVPFTLRDIQDQYVLYQRLGMEELVRSNYAKQNIYFLRHLPCLGAVMTSKKPVQSVADLDGLKVRATGLIGEMLAEAGAAVAYFPGPEIYGALEKGIVDAAVYGPLGTHYELGFHEVTDYVVLPPMASEADEAIVNLDAWNELPDDLQMLLTLAMAEHGERLAAIYRHESEEALKIFEKSGAQVSFMPEAERLKLTALGWKVVEKYAQKNSDFASGSEILKKYLQLIGSLD